MVSKRIEVTSLTSRCNGTSSVSWLFDIP